MMLEHLNDFPGAVAQLWSKKGVEGLKKEDRTRQCDHQEGVPGKAGKSSGRIEHPDAPAAAAYRGAPEDPANRLGAPRAAGK